MPVEVVVVIIYWTVLFKDEDFDDGHDYARGIVNHIFPFVSLLVDYLFSNYHLKFDISFYILLLVFILYTITNVMFRVVLDISVYSILDWVSVTSYVYYFAAFIVMYLTWFLITYF